MGQAKQRGTAEERKAQAKAGYHNLQEVVTETKRKPKPSIGTGRLSKSVSLALAAILGMTATQVPFPGTNRKGRR